MTLVARLRASSSRWCTPFLGKSESRYRRHSASPIDPHFARALARSRNRFDCGDLQNLTPKTFLACAFHPMNTGFSSIFIYLKMKRCLATCERPTMILTPADCLPENIRVLAVVVAELKLRDVQRKVLVADLVESADNTALKDAPETFNRIRVHRADNNWPADGQRTVRDTLCPRAGIPPNRRLRAS